MGKDKNGELLLEDAFWRTTNGVDLVESPWIRKRCCRVLGDATPRLR